MAGNSDKKGFIKELLRIFALLLNTKVDTAEKIKRIIKIAIETTLRRAKATLRRMQVDFSRSPILTQQKTINITKNGQIIKAISVRRKSRYFNGRSRLIF